MLVILTTSGQGIMWHSLTVQGVQLGFRGKFIQFFSYNLCQENRFLKSRRCIALPRIYWGFLLKILFELAWKSNILIIPLFPLQIACSIHLSCCYFWCLRFLLSYSWAMVINFQRGVFAKTEASIAKIHF